MPKWRFLKCLNAIREHKILEKNTNIQYFLRALQPFLHWYEDVHVILDGVSVFLDLTFPYYQCVTTTPLRRTCVTTTPLRCTTLEIIFEPLHESSNNSVCAASKASDQPAHTRSLIRAFLSRLNILRFLSY